MFVFFLIIRRPPRSTRTYTLFPYTTLVRSRDCAQVIVVGVEAFRLLALSPFDLGTFELRRDRADDACGHLILQVEDIVEGAFESLGPDMGAGRRIDELSGDRKRTRLNSSH